MTSCDLYFRWDKGGWPRSAEFAARSLASFVWDAFLCLPKTKKITINFGVTYTDKYGNEGNKKYITKYETNMVELKKYKDLRSFQNREKDYLTEEYDVKFKLFFAGFTSQYETLK